MEDKEIQRLGALLDERTMVLMERESDLADRMEEIEAQKEELTAAVEELESRNKMLETALEELKERNHELDQILYRASHDLRSPVTSIVGILNMLESDPPIEIQMKCFEHIRAKSSQMDELLKSLSTLSKTISNDIHFSTVNLDLTIRSCINDLRYLPNFSSVAIRTETENLSDVITDKLLLCIIIKNLLANSLTFREPAKGGLIFIHSTVFDSYFEIEITDDGVGISDSIKDKIFNMFYRGSEISTGSGLGLYIVKKIVDQLKGHMQFTSGDGLTRFKVVLPTSEVET
ncbi:MAG TPA: HAMP domain-containing sensor histidine kinase [Cyclobacteriaceae bacterium]